MSNRGSRFGSPAKAEQRYPGCNLATDESCCRTPPAERWLMIAISSLCNGFVGPRNAGRCSLSVVTATGGTLTAVSDAGKRADANNGAKQTDVTNKVPKAGLIIAIVSDSIDGDTARQPKVQSKIP
jgi:hypothetical protein